MKKILVHSAKSSLHSKELSADELKALTFRSMQGVDKFRPTPKLPIPNPLRIRFRSQWWVRCVNNELIEANYCHDAFVDINALYSKDHPCWNCPLGKRYRGMLTEDNFEAERKESLIS